MKYRRLGKSGLQVSELSFGSWATFGERIGLDGAKELMHLAYDEGVNFFDNAEGYARGQSEIIMGQVLADAQWRRDSFLISSKVYFGSTHTSKPNQVGLSRKHVVEACHQALQRLQVEYLDLYFCHRPDNTTPIEETVRAMSDLIRQGKVLYWGTSEWSAGQIMEAYSLARQYQLVPPTMEQPQYNLFWRDRVEREYHELYESIGLGTTIWSPLASGVLTGKYSGKQIPSDSRLGSKEYKWLKDLILNQQADKIDKADEIATFAKREGLDKIQLAIGWCLKNPRVSTVILGATKKEQLAHNLKSSAMLPKLTEEVMQGIEEIMQNNPQYSPM